MVNDMDINEAREKVGPLLDNLNYENDVPTFQEAFAQLLVCKTRAAAVNAVARLLRNNDYLDIRATFKLGDIETGGSPTAAEIVDYLYRDKGEDGE